MANLRSAKDLKNIVAHARMSNFPVPSEKEISTTRAISEIPEKDDISSDDDETYEMRFQKKGKAKFGQTTQSSARVNEFETKFLKQLELSQNDANMIEQLQKKICQQKIQIEELQQKLQQDPVEKQKELNEEFGKIIEKLRLENKNLTDTNAHQIDEIKKLKERLQEIKSNQNSEVQKITLDFKMKIESLNGKNTELHNLNTLNVQEIRNQKLKIDALQNQINSQGGSNQDNAQIILQLREQLKSANEIIKKNNLQFENKVDSTKKEIESYQNNVKSLEQQIKMLTKNNGTLIGDLNSIKAVNLKAQEQIKSKQQEIDSYMQKYKESNEKIEKLNQKVEQLNKELEKHKNKKLTDFEAKYKEMVQENKKLHENIGKLQSQIAQLQKDKDDIQNQKDQMQKNHEKLERELRENSKGNKSLSQEIQLLKQDVSRLNNDCIELRRKLEFKDIELTKIKQNEKSILDEKNTLKKQVTSLQQDHQSLNSRLKDLSDMTQQVKDILLVNDINLGPIENTISCLSCLNILKDPLTLNCGHSICKACFQEHSDPKSKDSLVFCEDCKLETKNKNLRELKTIKRISENYGNNKLNIDKIKDILSSEKYYLVTIN